MKSPEFYLLCFGIGTVWTLATALLGGLHPGHGHGGSHIHHGGHAHHTGHGHGHTGHAHSGHHHPGLAHWLANMTHPAILAVFLAWFGGVGFILTRHTGLLFWVDLAIAVAFGFLGAWLLARFLGFLQAREKPLDPADYELVGVLGTVSSPIRPDGVGELIYLRDGARRPLCARSEDGSAIQRGEEVVVTRFEKGVAYVRTWDAMLTQPGPGSTTETLPTENNHVQ
jgi:membrane protein implicated in regulation of membrane protease activity